MENQAIIVEKKVLENQNPIAHDDLKTIISPRKEDDINNSVVAKNAQKLMKNSFIKPSTPEERKKFLEKEMKLFMFANLLKKFSKKAKTRLKVIDELKSTERKYVQDIDTLLVPPFFILFLKI